jgi:hypothetical protein
MACIKLTIVLLLFGMSAEAQTFSEWFDQKSTLRKYLVQQVAALQAYEDVLKTGYGIAHKGLGSISGSNKSELGLHTNYYNKLKSTGAVVKNDPQVQEVTQWQADILTAFHKVKSDPYYQGVKTAVLSDCTEQLTQLQQVLADGKLEMSDSERLTRIHKIHGAMLDNYHFAVDFCNRAIMLEVQKIHETNDAQALKNYYGNH